MKFIRNHWYDLGLPISILAVIFLVLNWSSLVILQRLALMNFIVILWHQFEEYRLPGGEAAITNLLMQPSDKGPSDRYPLNQNNAFIINAVAAYIVYLLPVFFPTILWLGFMPIFFGMMQLIMHAYLTPKKLHSWYSPGLLAVFLGHFPIGIYWFYYTISTGIFNWTTLVFGLLYQLFFIGVFMLKIGYGLLQSPVSKYPFPKDEFERGGHAARIRKIKKTK